MTRLGITFTSENIENIPVGWRARERILKHTARTDIDVRNKRTYWTTFPQGVFISLNKASS